jgi:hypothetical protein
MAFTRKTVIAAFAAAATVGAGFAIPVQAGESRRTFDPQRLDQAAVDYSQYRGYRRGGWNRGGRGAAVAGAVGLGILGAAAIAASRPAYADPVYDYGPGYGYGYGSYDYRPAYGYGSYGPVYDEPTVVYQPRGYTGRQRYYGGTGPYADSYRGAPDPARGGR